MASESSLLEPSEAKIKQAQKDAESISKLLAARDLKQARKLLKQMQRLLAREEVNDAERFVAEAVRLLIADDPFFVDYIAAEKNGQLDERQIDIMINTQSSLGILIQVKSNKKDVELHYFGGKKGDREVKPHKYRIAIAPKEGMTAEELSIKLKRLAYAIIKNPKRTPIEWYERKNRQKRPR